MAREVVIRNCDGAFVGPSANWVSEYPEALLFGSIMEAERYFWKNRKKLCSSRFGLIQAAEDYGTITQRLISLNLHLNRNGERNKAWMERKS